MRGVEANKYYIDFKGDSPTDLFNKIGDHHSKMVMDRYLRKENEFVILVGVLET